MSCGELDSATLPASRFRRLVSLWPKWLPPLVVVGCVLLGNISYLSGYSVADPLGPRGHLATHLTQGVFAGDRAIDPNDGFLTQAEGRQVAHQLLHGQLPYWDPYSGVGEPLLASPQSAPLFPPTLLQSLPHGLLLEMLLLELVAALATFFVARRLRIHLAAATVAGVAFGLNGTFAWLQNGAMLPVAFLAVAVLGIERAVDRSGQSRRGGWCTFAVGLGLLIQGGFFETIYICGIFIAIWSIVRCWSVERSRRGAYIRKIAMGGATGLSLGAPLILPFARYLPFAEVGDHAKFGSRWLPTAAWPMKLGLPYAYGPIFAHVSNEQSITVSWGNVGGYLSASIVVLALVGVCGRSNRRLRVALGMFAVLCLVKTFGPQFVIDLIARLPRMHQVAFYRYMDPAMEFAMVVLAAFGISDLIERSVSIWQRGIVLLVVALLGAKVSAIAVTYVRPALNSHHAFLASFAWACLVTVTLGVGSLLRRRRWRIGLICAIAIVDVVAMYAIPTLSAPRSVTIDTTAVQWLQRHVGLQRAYSFGPIWPNYGSYFNVAFAANIDIPMPLIWADWLRHRFGKINLLDPVYLAHSATGFSVHPEALRELGVAYVLMDHRQSLPISLLHESHLVHTDDLADIYELDRPAPYFDVLGSSCTATAISRVEARVHCDHSGRLMRREQFFPGWNATVDGHNVRIKITHDLFQGVKLPAGDSVVRFQYVPEGFVLGAWFALVGCFAMFISLAMRTRARFARSLRTRSEQD